ncbi:MAG TPA: hypothetical protein PLV05_00720 [Verrucomicrobiota bacterium]|nr:hypothetical protein [Verrucomicrobiota bacterium]
MLIVSQYQSAHETSTSLSHPRRGPRGSRRFLRGPPNLLAAPAAGFPERAEAHFRDAGVFSRDLTARGQPLPPTVSRRELVSGGYIAAANLRAFDGMDVTISLTADEARPQEILIRVRMPDGSVTALLADGSIQGLRR